MVSLNIFIEYNQFNIFCYFLDPRANGDPEKKEMWIPALRLRGDKLRGDDIY